MKRILLTLVLGLGLLTANAQIEKLSGPRLGMTFIGAGPVADFLHEGFDFDDDRDGKYGSTGPAFTTQYGWQWESRFADGGGRGCRYSRMDCISSRNGTRKVLTISNIY